MVTKYIILADSKSDNTFKEPRQLTKINGETLLQRTVRLLRENGIKDIIITSHDKRFDTNGAKRYEPLYNDWNQIEKTGYWLSGFPIELLNQPVCFIFGDIYFSENAIKTIVETNTNSTLFFCSYQNKSKYYIKKHDEPLAYKVVDYGLFKNHINRVKRMKDKGLCVREPIVWELYRSINNQDINTHAMTKNYIAINDISCDIDSVKDIEKIQVRLGGKDMIKVEVIEPFTLQRFDELVNIERAGIETYGMLYSGDKFECTKDLCDYLMGNNPLKKEVVKIIEIKPVEEKKEIEPKPKASKKKKTSTK